MQPRLIGRGRISAGSSRSRFTSGRATKGLALAPTPCLGTDRPPSSPYAHPCAVGAQPGLLADPTLAPPLSALALAALACLYERPMRPYEIASTLRERPQG